MKKDKFLGLLIKMVVLVTFIGMLTACGVKSTRELLIGKWTAEVEGVTGTMEFTEDGNAIFSSNKVADISSEYEATEVEGDKTQLDVKIKENIERVVFKDDDTIIFLNQEFKRVK